VGEALADLHVLVLSPIGRFQVRRACAPRAHNLQVYHPKEKRGIARQRVSFDSHYRLTCAKSHSFTRRIRDKYGDKTTVKRS